MLKQYCNQPKKNTLFSIRTKDFLLKPIKAFLKSLEDFNVIIYLFQTKDLQYQITLHYIYYTKPP